LVEYRIKFSREQRITRIPKVLAEALGTSWVVRPNSRVAVVFSENADLKPVLKSLARIQEQLTEDAQVQTDRKSGK